MSSVSTNMLDAKTRLSQLVEAVESGEVDEVVLARNGRPAARIVALEAHKPVRIGVAKGRFVIPDSIDGLNEEIDALLGERDAPAP